MLTDIVEFIYICRPQLNVSKDIDCYFYKTHVMSTTLCDISSEL